MPLALVTSSCLGHSTREAEQLAEKSHVCLSFPKGIVPPGSPAGGAPLDEFGAHVRVSVSALV